MTTRAQNFLKLGISSISLIKIITNQKRQRDLDTFQFNMKLKNGKPVRNLRFQLFYLH